MNLNLLTDLPGHLPAEEILPLLASGPVRIERIVSDGHHSPPGFWYDQEEHEWVTVLRGRGVLEYASGEKVTLLPGDHLHIPPHLRHRVDETSDEEPTVWLAVFWRLAR